MLVLDSRIAAFSQNNDSLPEADEKSLRACIAAAKLDLVVLEGKMRDLAMQQRDLTSFLDSALPILAPIRKLPFELLAKIFSFCSKDVSVGDAPYCRLITFDSCPWNIGHVCSKWRHIVTSIPALWSVITATVLNIGPELSEMFAEVVKCVIARSGLGTLQIDVDAHGAQDDFVPGYEDALKAFVQEGPRWKSATLCLPSVAFPLIQSGTYPILECGTVAVYGPPGLDNAEIFMSSPLLRRAEIQTDIFESDFVSLPWSQLTHLTVGSSEPDGLDHILEMCVSLESLSLLDQFGPRQGSFPPVALPKLHSFASQSKVGLDVGFRLDLPSLQSFSAERLTPTSVKNLKRCLEKFQNSIRRLHLELFAISRVDESLLKLREGLTLCTNATHLSLVLGFSHSVSEDPDSSSDPVTIDIFSRICASLKFSGSKPPLLPALTSLAFDIQLHGADSVHLDDSILDIVQARSKSDPSDSVAQLHEFGLHVLYTRVRELPSRPICSSETIVRLRKLTEGMDAWIQWQVRGEGSKPSCHALSFLTILRRYQSPLRARRSSSRTPSQNQVSVAVKALQAAD